MANFMFPRTISVRRPNNNVSPAAGQVGYGGADPVQETIILTGIPCAIDFDRFGRQDPGNLPTDSKLPFYFINVPANQISDGQVVQNDIVQDDLNRRYQIVGLTVTGIGVTIYGLLLIV